MIWYVVGFIVVFIFTCTFIWRVIIPRMVDKRVEIVLLAHEEKFVARLIDFFEMEVKPIHETLKAYPIVIEQIHDDLNTLEKDVDLLSSLGQTSVSIKSNIIPSEGIDEDIKLPISPNLIMEDDPLPIEGHTLLVGQTGAGKTNSLMMATISRINAGHIVQISDGKNELAPIFEKHTNIYESQDTTKNVRLLIQVAKDRMKLFGDESRNRGEPIRDIDEYEEITGKTMPRISLIVEELVLLAKSISTSELIDLYVAGRSSGVFVFAATQLLKDSILPRECSVNITNRIFLGAPDVVSMRVLFGKIPEDIRVQASQFLGPSGNALVHSKKNHQYSFVSLPRVSRDVLKELMK